MRVCTYLEFISVRLVRSLSEAKSNRVPPLYVSISVLSYSQISRQQGVVELYIVSIYMHSINAWKGDAVILQLRAFLFQ